MNQALKIKINIFEQFVFDIFYFNILAISALYMVFPKLSSLLPSNILAVLPVILSIVLIVVNGFHEKKFTLDEIFLFIVFSFFVVMTLMGNAFMRGRTLSSSFIVIVVFSLFCLTRKNIEKTVAHLKFDALFVAFIYTILAFLNDSNVLETTSYDVTGIYMKIGYGISLQAIILFEYGNKNSRFDYFLAAFFSIIIIAFGNRGALLVILVYIFILVIQKSAELQLYKRAFFLTFCISIMVLFVVFRDAIVLKFVDLFLKLGFDSRSLSRASNDKFFVDTDRTYIRSVVINMIKQHPFAIRGPGYLVNISTGDDKLIANAHNLILELIVEYGIVLGSMISFALLYIFFKAYKLCKKSKNDVTILIYCSLLHSLIMLMFSSSIYLCNEFWIGIAMLIAYRKENNKIVRRHDKKKVVKNPRTLNLCYHRDNRKTE